jgi:hypothetical protein
MASAELLKIAHNFERTVTDVDTSVQLVRGDVQDVGKSIEDKLDQANRSSFPQLTTFHAEGSNISQAINFEITFYDGFRPQIHPPTIISRQKLIMTARLNGSSEAVYSGNGNPLVPFYGFMESVRSSVLSTRRSLMAILYFIAGPRKERAMVRPSSSQNCFLIFTWSTQFIDHSRYYSLA